MRHKRVVIVGIFYVEPRHLLFHLYAVICVVEERTIMEVDTIKWVKFHQIEVIFHPGIRTRKHTLNQIGRGDDRGSHIESVASLNELIGVPPNFRVLLQKRDLHACSL